MLSQCLCRHPRGHILLPHITKACGLSSDASGGTQTVGGAAQRAYGPAKLLHYASQDLVPPLSWAAPCPRGGSDTPGNEESGAHQPRGTSTTPPFMDLLICMATPPFASISGIRTDLQTAYRNLQVVLLCAHATPVVSSCWGQACKHREQPWGGSSDPGVTSTGAQESGW